MDRTTAIERNENAKRLFSAHPKKVALMFHERISRTNPYITRVQISAVVPYGASAKLEIVAEATLGRGMALYELVSAKHDFVGDELDSMVHAMSDIASLSKKLKKWIGYRVTYFDGCVMMLEE